MMVKSGLEFFTLKSYVPLQRYLLTCQANSASLGRFFLLWAAATLKELVEFQNKKYRPLFTIIFNPKMLVSRPEILVHLFYQI